MTRLSKIYSLVTLIIYVCSVTRLSKNILSGNSDSVLKDSSGENENEDSEEQKSSIGGNNRQKSPESPAQKFIDLKVKTFVRL